MSGPAIHHILARQTVHNMKKGATGAKLDFLNKADTEWAPYLHFGCQGPDPLFFNLKDIDPNLREVAKTYLDVLEFMEDFKETVLAAVPPQLLEAADKLKEAWDDTVERSVLLSEINQGLTEAKNTIDLLGKTVVAGVKKYVTDAVNVYDVLLTHPIQDKGKYTPGSWWWFDTLHYRKSGQYAAQLLKNAKPNSAQMAYALGYLTHFSADTVGHPFVNIISGGPYRTHAQRHKFVENHQDVYAWRKHMGGEFIQSKVGDQYIIGGDDDTLPPDFNAYILKTMHEVYGTGGLNYGKPMNSEDLDDTYQLWLRWFRSTTNTLDLPKPVPYSLTKEMEEAWEKFKDNMGDAFDGVTGSKKGKKSIWEFFKSLAKAILGAIAAAAAIVDFLLGVIATLGAAPIRFMIAVAYEALYNAFMQFHQGVVLNGLAFPFNKQLNHYAAVHSVHSGVADTTGVKASDIRAFLPLKKYKLKTASLESHLVYPRPAVASLEDGMVENSRATAAPGSYFNADPFHYMWGHLSLSKEYYDFVKSFSETKGWQGSTVDPDTAFTHFARMSSGGGLGNAVDFGSFLFAEFEKGNAFPDFNLDGDRGYGFPCWRRVDGPANFNNNGVLHVAVEEVGAFVKHQVLNTETDIIHPNNDIL